MARQPDGPQARTETVTVRLTPAGIAELDRQRGTRTRSGHLRHLLAKESRNQ